jgi:type I restriction enzyme, R subunit
LSTDSRCARQFAQSNKKTRMQRRIIRDRNQVPPQLKSESDYTVPDQISNLQTTNVFKRHLPSAAAVNALDDPEQIADARVLVSTYPTMLRLIDVTKDGRRSFGPGHFDLVIIDEAHRSVCQKYRAIFECFDSFLVALTATPKDEVDHNTYGLFDLEDGVPTDAYGLDEAVRDKFLDQ